MDIGPVREQMPLNSDEDTQWSLMTQSLRNRDKKEKGHNSLFSLETSYELYLNGEVGEIGEIEDDGEFPPEDGEADISSLPDTQNNGESTWQRVMDVVLTIVSVSAITIVIIAVILNIAALYR